MSDHKYDKKTAIPHKDGLEIIDCQTCGFKHAYPYPDENKLREFYQKHYHAPTKGGNYQAKLEGLNRIVKNKPNKTILDIGCSDGECLSYFQKDGWQTFGIEPSESESELARKRGINVVTDSFAGALKRDLGKYDAVMLGSVLEHHPAPEKFCRQIYDKLLNRGGALCIQVPNDFNAFQLAAVEYYKKEMWWVVPPAHLNYFSFDSLTKFIEKIGFEIVSTESSFPIELFLLGGMDYIGNDTIGKKAFAMQCNFETVLEATGKSALKRQIYKSLAKLGLGRVIIMFGRKG